MKTLLLISFLLLSGLAFAQNQTTQSNESVQRFPAKIKSIVLYLDGAEISHTQTVKLEQGRNKIIFEGITQYVLTESIRATTDTEVSILAINPEIKYLKNKQLSPRVKELADSLKWVKNKVQDLQDNKDAYKTEKEMLLKNQTIGGQNNGVASAELKASADLFRNRLIEINRKLSDIEQENTRLAEVTINLKTRYDSAFVKQNYQRTEVEVLLSSETAKTTTIELKYLVHQSGWSPIYDISVEDVNQDVKFVYRANVYNNTGIDWNNLKFVLSTANPWESANKPELKAWYLNYVNPYATIDYKNRRGYNQNMQILQSNEMEQQSGGKEKSIGGEHMVASEMTILQGYKPENGTGNWNSVKTDASTGDYEIDVPDLSAEFDIATPYTIPSDNKPYLLDVATHKLPATYKHYVAPKVDKDAFLLARIRGWEDLNLVEGVANVFFAGSFVGQSYIYTRNVKDTLDLSLGRDKKVVVSRSKLKDYSSDKFIGSKRRETLSYQIVVKNNRKSAIDIEIKDQVPISQNSEIKVDVSETSNAKQDLITGDLTWKFNIQPTKSETVKFTFDIEYPKNKSVIIQQSQKRALKR